MKKSGRIALGGMLAALSVVIMFLASAIPFFVFAFPAIAGLLLIPVCVELDWRWGIGVYAVTALLSLLLVPDREAVFYYLGLFGHYPVTKLFLERIRSRGLRTLAKLGAFGASVSVCLLLTLWVFGMNYLLAEYGMLGSLGLGLFGGAALLALFLYDYVLSRFSVLYVGRFQKKLRKLFR